MQKRLCVFCNEEKTQNDFNKEHIIPDALGNESLIIDCVCKDCNSLLGSRIDVHLTDSFYLIGERTKLKLKGKSGKVPYILTNATGMKTVQNNQGVSLKYNKKKEQYDIRVHPKVIDEEDGRTKIIASTEDEIINIANTRKMRKNGKGLSDKERLALIKEIEKNKKTNEKKENREGIAINIKLEYDLRKIELAFLKIAYELLYFISISSGDIINTEKLRNEETINKIREVLYLEMVGNDAKDEYYDNYWEVSIKTDRDMEEFINKDNVTRFEKNIERILGNNNWHFINILNINKQKEIIIIIRLLNIVTSIIVIKNIEIADGIPFSLPLIVDSTSKRCIPLQADIITKLIPNLVVCEKRD